MSISRRDWNQQLRGYDRATRGLIKAMISGFDLMGVASRHLRPFSPDVAGAALRLRGQHGVRPSRPPPRPDRGPQGSDQPGLFLQPRGSRQAIKYDGLPLVPVVHEKPSRKPSSDALSRDHRRRPRRRRRGHRRHRRGRRGGRLRAGFRGAVGDPGRGGRPLQPRGLHRPARARASRPRLPRPRPHLHHRQRHHLAADGQGGGRHHRGQLRDLLPRPPSGSSRNGAASTASGTPTPRPWTPTSPRPRRSSTSPRCPTRCWATTARRSSGAPRRWAGAAGRSRATSATATARGVRLRLPPRRQAVDAPQLPADGGQGRGPDLRPLPGPPGPPRRDSSHRRGGGHPRPRDRPRARHA